MMVAAVPVCPASAAPARGKRLTAADRKKAITDGKIFHLRIIGTSKRNW
jgi:hypothetical protein